MPASLKYIAVLLRTTLREAKRRPFLHVGILVFVGVLSYFTMPHDREWLNQIRYDPEVSPGMHDLAGEISYYSMYVFTPLLYCAGIWIFGWLTQRNRFKRAALICFVAATAGGILVNFMRPGFGRPRPRAELEDHFYWFETKSHMLSFPSGHVMSNMSGAVALTIVEPWIGIPYVVMSAASGWSRMQRAAHYPTDVTVGMLFGIGVGIAFARGARVMKREEDPLEKEAPSRTSASGQN